MLFYRPIKRGLIQRARTQANLPDNALNRRLQSLLEIRTKSVLNLFASTGKSDEDNHTSNRSSSPSFGTITTSSDAFGILDTIHDDSQDGSPKTQSSEGSVDETSVLNALNKPYHFTDYIASSQNTTPIPELIMRMFDNDDIDGIIPTRFLEDGYPDAVLYNVRIEHSAFSSVAASSSQSSLDGEASLPSYDVKFVTHLRKRLWRVSTALVTHASFSNISESSPSPTDQLSDLHYIASESDKDSCASPVSNDEYDNELSPVLPQFNQQRRRSSLLRSPGSVLRWLAGRSDSHRDSVCSVAEEDVFTSSSEESDVESYRSSSDDDVVAA